MSPVTKEGKLGVSQQVLCLIAETFAPGGTECTCGRAYM